MLTSEIQQKRGPDLVMHQDRFVFLGHQKSLIIYTYLLCNFRQVNVHTLGS